MFGTLSSFDSGLFDAFRRMEHEMDDAFGRWPWPAEIRSAGRGAYPPANVGATPEKVDIYVFAAGLDPKALNISLEQNLLTIAGQRQVPEKEEARYYRQERFNGEFRRAITLPGDVDPDRVEARYRDGLLHITVPRPEAARPRQIEVK